MGAAPRKTIEFIAPVFLPDHKRAAKESGALEAETALPKEDRPPPLVLKFPKDIAGEAI